MRPARETCEQCHWPEKFHGDKTRVIREYASDEANSETVTTLQIHVGGGSRALGVGTGVDCHNRPAHTLFAGPERAVDAAIASGRLPRELPFVRREAVAAVGASYPDRAAALDAIARRLGEFYRERGGVDGRLVERAVAASQDVWARNVYPAMQVTWGTYPNFLGHVDAPGCFRCHDDEHKTKDGRTIGQDCELCHTIQ